MVTSDFSPEVEIRPFRACAMHPAIIIGTVRSLWTWTWLWGRYHVPQNAFLVFHVFLFYFNIFFFFLFPVILYYSYTQTFSLSLLCCCYSYCVSFCALLDGVCLSRNKRITYLLTYLVIYGLSTGTAISHLELPLTSPTRAISVAAELHVVLCKSSIALRSKWLV